jgi:hypothetical protein
VDAGISEANLFVLSDGTATVFPSGLTSDWPAGYVVQYHDLLAAPRSNHWVSGVEVRRGSQRGAGLAVAASLGSVGAVPEQVEVELRLSGDISVLREIRPADLGKGGVSFSLPVSPEGATEGWLELSADGLPADDLFPFVLDGERALPVLLISGDGGSNPRDDEVYYLERALEPGPGSSSRVRPRVVSAEEVRRLEGGPGSVIFLANVANPEPLIADLLRGVEAGGGLFISVGSNVDPDVYNDLLGDLLPARFTEVKTRGRGTFETAPVGLSVPSLDQEEFRVFRSGGARGFSRVGFGKVLGTEPRLIGDSRVLLRYSDGLPALLERRVGQGRVVLFTSSLDDDWTDFPLRSIYVTLMHQFARGLSGSLLFEGSPELEVGARLPLPVPPDSRRPAWVQAPDGSEIRLEAAAADGEGRVLFGETRAAGHYSLYWGGAPGETPSLVGRFSVRVPQAESRLVAVDANRLLSAVPGLIFHGQGEAVAEARRGEIVRRASALPFVLLILALFLLGETVVAGRRS